MGLDMYLEARRHLPPSDVTLAPTREAIGLAVGYTPPKEKPGDDPTLLEVTGVMVRVGYWNRLFPLHGWFVTHTMDGHDDDRAAYVSPEILVELEEQLDRVADAPLSACAFFAVEEGEALVASDVAYTLKVLVQARKLQANGWDIYYRTCS